MGFRPIAGSTVPRRKTGIHGSIREHNLATITREQRSEQSALALVRRFGQQKIVSEFSCYCYRSAEETALPVVVVLQVQTAETGGDVDREKVVITYFWSVFFRLLPSAFILKRSLSM